MPVKIALIGMPGGGKSTVGRHLARRLGWGFIDSDGLIEKRTGESIRSYFEREGEEAFRDLEQSVIATGGGACLREANRQALHTRCTVVYLQSTPEELHRRLRNDTQRPLLQVADPLARLRELYAKRDPLYRECSHFVIETGRPSVSTLVNMILMQLELAGVVESDLAHSPVDPVQGPDRDDRARRS